jgi:phage-related protein
VTRAFQKKSKTGIATPKAELDLIQQRLKRAIEIQALMEKQNG